MQEFIAGFFKTFEERVNSTLYGAFLLALIVWNYDIFLTIFFVSNETIIALEKMTKAIYIRDVLYPTIWGKDIYCHFGAILGRIITFLYHIGIPLILAYFMIWHMPKLGTMAHKKEKEFLKEREEENIRYKENIAGYKLEHSKKQDELLQKQKKDAETQANIIKLQESTFNKKAELSQKQNGNNIEGTDDLMTDAERKKYEKIVGSEKARESLIKIIKLLDPNNEASDTVNDSMGIDNKSADEFSGIYDWKVVGKTLRKDLETGDYMHYFYLKEFGKKVLLQMVKDDYLKEEDLEGKI